MSALETAKELLFRDYLMGNSVSEINRRLYWQFSMARMLCLIAKWIR